MMPHEIRLDADGALYLDAAIELALRIGEILPTTPALQSLHRDSLRFFIETAAVDLHNQTLDRNVDKSFIEIFDDYITNLPSLIDELIADGSLETKE